MNIRRAHKEFEVFLDKVDTQALPDILPEEKDIFIHEAELRLVQQTYGGNNIHRKGFQETQKRTDDINTLVRHGFLKPELIDDKTYKFSLGAIHRKEDLSDTPEKDYMIYLSCRIKVKSNRVTTPTYTDGFLSSIDDLPRLLNDPYNAPKIHTPILSFAEGSIYVHTDGSFTPTLIKLTYLKYPRPVSYRSDISSELPEHKQREALQLAVRIALGAIESPRTEEQNQQLTSLE